MTWFKYIFHKHRWYYYGKFTDQYLFRCEICHRIKRIVVVNREHYTINKIVGIKKQMNNSISHLE